MTSKGKQYTAEDAPRGTADKEAWAKKETERYKVVAVDRGARHDRQPIIAEELTARTIARLKSPKARRMVGNILRMARDDRLEVLTAFASDGTPKNPFSVKG